MTGMSLLLMGLLLSTGASGASINGQTIDGDILNSRIAACGVEIDGTDFARLRPFIETSEALAGSVQIAVTKRSASGVSQTSQTNRFADGSLGAIVITVDKPSRVAIEMAVIANDGTPLCRLQTDVELDEHSIRL
ncbi:hypothetical protein D5400_08850 [Georhizobium profundi]|jgi:hypothetical protein|uniref:Uncharacterized protein n=1 Tax=Georhizobium profundi TaxID=2341112 RepID=A0A3S9B362_9HYPH|nr:curli-like amyloid fiber formation chaperone CsgH [Georhizobium profundi]AZN71363.1 hypothetical protein D5400_08850 [Georhizobium profundi]